MATHSSILAWEIHGQRCKTGDASSKESACQSRRHKRHGFNPGSAFCRREWLPTPVFLPGKFQGQRSLVGYSPWDHKESDMTERTHARARAHTHTHTHRSDRKVKVKVKVAQSCLTLTPWSLQSMELSRPEYWTK